MKLTGTESALLAEAAARDDGMLRPPPSLAPKARERIATRLVRHGLAAPVPAADDPGGGWNASAGAGEHATALQLTEAGVAAVAETVGTARDAAGERAGLPAARRTKRAILIALLARADGARLDDMTGATGWQRHTVRAALTRLRKEGFSVERLVREGEGARYRIVAAPDAAASPEAEGPA